MGMAKSHSFPRGSSVLIETSTSDSPAVGRGGMECKDGARSNPGLLAMRQGTSEEGAAVPVWPAPGKPPMARPRGLL